MEQNQVTAKETRVCPRCGRRFAWPDEYVAHAWTEKP